jgi:4,5-dihydroxyphthalate decarboxylase
MQKPNVPEWKDPPNVTMVAPQSLSDMLFAGEVDAIVVDPVPKDPRIRTVIPDALAATEAWQKRHNAIQINHMVVVKDELCATDPHAVRDAWKLLAQSKAQAGETAERAAFTPFGLEANRRNIQVLVDYMFDTKMIPTRYGVDELFNDVTRNLA